MSSKKRDYKKRKGVDWYVSGIPKHNQKRVSDGYYYNGFNGYWCRNKCRKKLVEKGEIRLFDFSCYPLSCIKMDFGAKNFERVGLFITMLYADHLMSRDEDSDWDFEYWSDVRLKVVLGDERNNLINKLIELKKIEVKIKNTEYYDKMKYLKLSSEYKNEYHGTYCIRYVESEVLNDAIIKLYKSKIYEEDEVLLYIKKVLLRTELVIENIEVVIDDKWRNKQIEYCFEKDLEFVGVDDRKKMEDACANPELYEKEYKRILRSYYEFLEFVAESRSEEEKDALCFVRRSSFGDRIVHLHSNTPKEFRRYMRIMGSEVVEVDIKASQPSFLFYWMQKPFDAIGDLAKSIKVSFSYPLMSSVVSKSKRLDLYLFMAIKMYGLGWRRNRPNARAEMKKLFYRLVYGNSNHEKIGGYKRDELILKIFGTDMFEFINQFANVDLGFNLEKGDLYKQLVFILQRIEAGFLLEVMREHIRRELPFLPLYDSLIVRKQDEAKSRAIFNYVIQKRKLKEYISIK